MSKWHKRWHTSSVLVAAATICSVAVSARVARDAGLLSVFDQGKLPAVLAEDESYPNAEGAVGVYLKGGPARTSDNPFFLPIGENGRACATCHVPSDGMALSTRHVRQRYLATKGKDPLFAAIDGAICPSAVERAGGKFFKIDDPRNPYSLLLNHGLFRIHLPWPPRAEGQPGQPSQRSIIPFIVPEFTIEVISDPSGCNTDPVYGIDGSKGEISVFRRPLMAANLKFSTSSTFQFGWPTDTLTLQRAEVDPATGKLAGGGIMFDGREVSLESQAFNAAMIHHQAKTPLTPQQIKQIVDFESRIYTAQLRDRQAGKLTDGGAEGGPRTVETRRAGWTQIDGIMFPEFEKWRNDPSPHRRSIARGADIFNKRKFIVRNVSGVNDVQATFFSNAFSIGCSNCHSTRGSGTESVTMNWRDIGTSGNHPEALPADYLPTFRLTCKPGKTTAYFGQVVITHDPGRALITGKCADIGKVKSGNMRSLAARSPYFHNGSAKNVRDIVEFYDKRFDIKYTEQEKEDLVNFMNSL